MLSPAAILGVRLSTPSRVGPCTIDIQPGTRSTARAPPFPLRAQGHPFPLPVEAYPCLRNGVWACLGALLQTYTAVYYVLADMLMFFLYFYSKYKNRRSFISAPINAAFLFISFGAVAASPLVLQLELSAPHEAFRSRTLLGLEPTEKGFTKQEIIGFIIGSISSLLYLLSRLPQIYTNFQRKSTQGISYSMFALVILGNTAYGLSVLLKNPEPGQSKGSFLIHHLPWLIGSLGVLLLDILISIQFFIYRNQLSSSLEREPLLGQNRS
uniref:Lysosomal amino acid transporter 1 homolog n=1 Tax=Monodelphis domestica TaxID=13616 RepID=A0A5F8GXE8_MONDO